MKPVLHIIGIGKNSNRMGTLPLEVYRLLKAVAVIFVLEGDHLVKREMIEEGLLYRELHITKKNTNGQEPVWGIGQAILDQIDNVCASTEVEEAVLALPGNPVAEGKLVSSIQTVLIDTFHIETGLLTSNNSLQKLESIMAELRSNWGCPWDKEQNHHTLKKYLVEETYEVIDAIDTNDMNNFCEELGDLLLQIVFHSTIAGESGNFDLEDVIRGICDKLIRRHPHVFGTVEAKSSQEVIVNWDRIKKQEKALSQEPESRNIFSIPKGLPALLMAEKTQKEAAKIGFDWDSYQGPLAKIYEELGELEKEIGTRTRLEEELGDVLFSIVNLSRFFQLNSEEALRQGTKKFQRRFNRMMNLIDSETKKKEKLTLKEMDYYWDLVKKTIK